MLDDIVIFQTSDKKRKFGIIIEILEKNRIKVKTTLYGVVQDVEKHIRLLILIFRKSEWNADGTPKSFT